MVSFQATLPVPQGCCQDKPCPVHPPHSTTSPPAFLGTLFPARHSVVGCSFNMEIIRLLSYLLWGSFLSLPVSTVPTALRPAQPPCCCSAAWMQACACPCPSLPAPAWSKDPTSFHLDFSKICRSLVFHGQLQVAEMMDIFPQPFAFPLMPFALHMVLASLASFPSMLALLSSLKEIRDARSALCWPCCALPRQQGNAPARHIVPGVPPGPCPHPPGTSPGNIPRDTTPSAAGVTYGPEVTMTLRTRSKPRSARFRHSAVNSICLPWKFSWSKTTIWGCKERVG